jgi:hypothetical protein
MQYHPLVSNMFELPQAISMVSLLKGLCYEWLARWMWYFLFTLPSISFQILNCLHNSVTFFVVISFICKNAGKNIYDNLFFLLTAIKSEMFYVNFVLVLSELSVKHGLIVFILYSTVISEEEYSLNSCFIISLWKYEALWNYELVCEVQTWAVTNALQFCACKWENWG